MTTRQMSISIAKTAIAMRREFKQTMPKEFNLIDINTRMPYVGFTLPDGREYFFQGEEADNLLDEAKAGTEKFDVSTEDMLLWMSNSWG